MSDSSIPSQSSANTSREVAVEIKGVSKRFGDFVALNNVSLTIYKGEFFSLLGPSGCGKTTLLRIIAGLEFASEGEVRIGGVDVGDVPAYRRPVNTVFQSYALFPHLTVRENISFGLRMANRPESEITERVQRVIDLVQISKFSDRKPQQLSGGQRQRVALARAVVNEPKVLLLDEPMGALDMKLRKELQVELLNLQRRLGISFIYVTHDQEEALVMSDRIAVVNEGRIEQIGAAEEMYERPRTKFVSNFLGTSNVFDAVVKRREAESVIVDSRFGELRVDLRGTSPELAARERFTLAIRPEKVTLIEGQDIAGENRVAAKIKQLVYIGSETHYLIETPQMNLSAEIMNTKVGSQGFDIGENATAFLQPAGLIILED